MLAATTAEVDKAGRDLFNALRDYQVEYLKHKTDPQIDSKLAIIYECVWDSLVYSHKGVDEKVVSLIRSQHQAVIELEKLNYYPDLQSLFRKIQTAANKLFSLFIDKGV